MADTKKNAAVDTDKMKERLLEQRDALLRDLEIKEHQVAEDADDLDPERGGVGNHMADDANETSEQETMLTLETNLRRQRDQVEAALGRIEAGTYGICTNCGEPIPAERLEALPWATTCIDCKRKEERT